jgi:hypothetical protein
MVAAALSVAAGTISAQAPIRVTSDNVRLDNYLHDLAGPGALVGIVGGSLLDQVRNKHGSFDDGVNGFAQQMAARAGEAAVQVSVRHGLAALMHRSTGYQPCHCHGFGPKVGHAFLETFTDLRPDGSRALAVPDLAGAYAGSFASLAWRHDRNVGDALIGTTLSFGFSALFNVARELTGLAR